MALDFEQMKELEILKHQNKVVLADIARTDAITEQTRKMERLEKLLEIAKAGGAGLGGGD